MARFDVLLPEMRPGLQEVPDFSHEAALRRCAAKFTRETHVWQADLERFALRVGQTDYELDTGVEGAQVEKLLTVLVGDRAIDRQYRMSELRSQLPPKGYPQGWALNNDATLIVFDRVPQTEDQGKVVAIYAVLRTSNTARELPDFLVDEWHDALVAGARAELFGQRVTPWSNPDAAREEAHRYELEKARAKREQISGNHALLRARPRRFI